MSKDKVFFIGLDKLRFYAFLLVFWQHTNTLIIKKIKEQSLFNFTSLDFFEFTGGLGVQFFFVLSGFLITFLLYKEENRFGQIKILNFYLRRVLRIWPVYYAVMIVGVFLIPFLFQSYLFKGNYWMSFLFLNNFDVKNQLMITGISWSVAIEEQFYALWPLFFVFIKKKWLVLLSFFIAVISIYFNVVDPQESYFSSIGNMIYLMIGCIGAIVFYKKNHYFEVLRNRKIYMLLHILIVFFFFIRLKIDFVSFTILPLLFLFIIISLVIRNDLQKKSHISRLGKYTYGMYLYHPLIILLIKVFMDKLNLDYRDNLFYNILLLVLSFLLTIIFAKFSYTYFEKFFLKLKVKFE